MLAHYYCLHFAYHLEGEAKHISWAAEIRHRHSSWPTPIGQGRRRGSLFLREDCYNVVTWAPTVGNDSVVPHSKRERGVHARAMLFWVLAALAVVGALAIVWGLYLLGRRWL
jgi:hypothetical protein